MFPHGTPFGTPNNPRFQPPRRVGQNEPQPSSNPSQQPDYVPQHDTLFSYISQMPPPVMPQTQMPGSYQYGFAPYAQMPGSYPVQNTQVPEVVAETQPGQRAGKETAPSKPAKRSHKKKPANEPRAKKTVLPWTSDEEVALARCWLDISMDPDIANFQGRHVFWDRVRDKFVELMQKDPDYRRDDSISGKWSDMNSKCQHFQSVYQRTRDKWQSGASDLDIQNKAMDEFSRTKGTFQYLSVWNVLRNHPKWDYVPGMHSKPKRSTKRSKTSSSGNPDSQASDAHNFDLNLSEDEEVEEIEPPRPLGKKSSKRKDKGVQSSSSGSELAHEVSEMNNRLDAINELGKKRFELRQEQLQILKDRQMQKDLDRLAQPIDHLTGADRVLAERVKQRIREKYGI